jgi:hypothetical protein
MRPHYAAKRRAGELCTPGAVVQRQRLPSDPHSIRYSKTFRLLGTAAEGDAVASAATAEGRHCAKWARMWALLLLDRAVKCDLRRYADAPSSTVASL